MLRQRFKQEEKAQVYLEYALVVGAIILIMLAMSTMIKRGSQSMIKTVADQVGNQINAEQRFDESGHLDSSNAATTVNTRKERIEFVGDITYNFQESITTQSQALINLGFTNAN